MVLGLRMRPLQMLQTPMRPGAAVAGAVVAGAAVAGAGVVGAAMALAVVALAGAVVAGDTPIGVHQGGALWRPRGWILRARPSKPEGNRSLPRNLSEKKQQKTSCPERQRAKDFF